MDQLSKIRWNKTSTVPSLSISCTRKISSNKIAWLDCILKCFLRRINRSKRGVWNKSEKINDHNSSVTGRRLLRNISKTNESRNNFSKDAVVVQKQTSQQTSRAALRFLQHQASARVVCTPFLSARKNYYGHCCPDLNTACRSFRWQDDACGACGVMPCPTSSPKENFYFMLCASFSYRDQLVSRA